MDCPFCGGQKTIVKRKVENIRDRYCESCKRYFRTIEILKKHWNTINKELGDTLEILLK